MSKLIIFDFDGVLADSLDVVYTMNKDAVKSINQELSLEEYCACFEGHINQRLAQMYGLDEEQKKKLVDFKAVLYPQYYNAKTVHLFPFAKELIIEASKLGELWIVSSSPADLISDILESQGLVKSFAKIVGQNRQPKSLFFQESLAEYTSGEVFFITDTVGDIREIRKAGVDVSTVAVTWGFHEKALLASENPTVVVSASDEIINFIKEY